MIIIRIIVSSQIMTDIDKDEYKILTRMSIKSLLLGDI